MRGGIHLTRHGLLLLILLLIVGCGPVRSSSAPSPTPLPSAAQPAVAGKGDLAYARRGAESIRQFLLDLQPDQAVSEMQEWHPLGGLLVQCAGATGEIAVLACHYGPDKAQPIAQAIFWREGETWNAQLYPQAAARLARERQEALAPFECSIGCFGTIKALRAIPGSESAEFVSVVDLGVAGKIKAEEVQVLQLDDGYWTVLWAPGSGDWNYGHAEVTLPKQWAASFAVHSSSWGRQDTLSGYLTETESGEHRWFEDRWVHRSNGFQLQDHREVASPYGTLVRLIHYLSAGADEKAQALLAPSVSLPSAQKALAQKPKRQGWKVMRLEEGSFLLDTGHSGKPDRGVRLIRRGDGWVVSEIRQTPP